MADPSQSYGASPAIWDHTVLPATRHRWTRPTLTPAIQAGTRFTYPRGMEGWVDVGYIPRWFTCLQTFTHPGSNHLIVTRPGVELAIFWSKSNVLTVTPPSCCIVVCLSVALSLTRLSPQSQWRTVRSLCHSSMPTRSAYLPTPRSLFSVSTCPLLPLLLSVFYKVV